METDHIRQAARFLEESRGLHKDAALEDAETLAAAGLLVTLEQRAVLDAADKWRDTIRYVITWVSIPANATSCGRPDPAGAALVAAVDALRAATPKNGET